MSSWRTHLPDEFVAERVVGLGMNAVEMMENPQLHDMVVHDLNVDPTLPFEDARVRRLLRDRLDPIPDESAGSLRRGEPRTQATAAACTSSTPTACSSRRPSPSGNRLDDEGRGLLVGTYFENSGGWSAPEVLDISPGSGTDPVYVVRAFKSD